MPDGDMLRKALGRLISAPGGMDSPLIHPYIEGASPAVS